MILVGDTAHVLARGEFYGQEVPVLKIEQDRGGNLWYQMAVIWPEPKHERPSWFEADEIESVSIISRHGLKLTEKQRTIVNYRLSGYTYVDIAQMLSISAQTVKNHLSKVYRKFGVHSVLQLKLILEQEEQS